MSEIVHTDYLYSSQGNSFGFGNKAEIRNPYLDNNPGPPE